MTTTECHYYLDGSASASFGVEGHTRDEGELRFNMMDSFRVGGMILSYVESDEGDERQSSPHP